jgi:hypothetical protein
MATKKSAVPVPVEHITQSIFILRGQRVLLDSEFAALMASPLHASISRSSGI